MVAVGVPVLTRRVCWLFFQGSRGPLLCWHSGHAHSQSADRAVQHADMNSSHTRSPHPLPPPSILLANEPLRSPNTTSTAMAYMVVRAHIQHTFLRSNISIHSEFGCINTRLCVEKNNPLGLGSNDTALTITHGAMTDMLHKTPDRR